MRLGATLLVVLLAVTTACSSGNEDPTSPTAPATSVVETEREVAGNDVLVSATRADQPDVDGDVWKVEYRITGITGEPTVVTGVVVRPRTPAPEGWFPILAWAHGTIGVADACIPANSFLGELGIPEIDHHLAAGFVVAAADYEGLGSAGTHPYLVPESEARSVLGIADAARSIDGADASDRVVLLGHSQGGGAVLEALALHDAVAPELDVVGGAVLATSGGLVDVIPSMFRERRLAEFALLVAVSWGDVYADLETTDVVGPRGQAAADAARQDKCLNELEPYLGDTTIDELFPTKPDELPAWQARLAENRVDPSRIDLPVFVGGGGADPLIPVTVVDTVVAELCRSGVVVTEERYPMAGHGATVTRALGDVHAWAQERLAGEPVARDACSR